MRRTAPEGSRFPEVLPPCTFRRPQTIISNYSEISVPFSSARGSGVMPNPLESCKALLVRRWGEMGGYWGINRTMAEIHALLFVAPQPLCSDDIMDQLKISRGNASMNLRALVDWGLIDRVHRLGDRRDYYKADTDVWHMFETIMRERRRREVEPIIATIDHCCEQVDTRRCECHGADPAEIELFRQ